MTVGGAALAFVQLLFVAAVGWLVIWGRQWAKNVANAELERFSASLKLKNDEHITKLDNSLQAARADDRSQFEQLIENQRQEAAKLLESQKADHQREAAQFSLYATERHRAYPKIYQAYRISTDLLVGAMKTDNADAARRALNVFEEAKKSEILEDLYLSWGVRDYLDYARTRIAQFSVEVTSEKFPGTNAAERMLNAYSAANLAVHRLRDAMQQELRTATEIERPTDYDYGEWRRIEAGEFE